MLFDIIPLKQNVVRYHILEAEYHILEAEYHILEAEYRRLEARMLLTRPCLK